MQNRKSGVMILLCPCVCRPFLQDTGTVPERSRKVSRKVCADISDTLELSGQFNSLPSERQVERISYVRCEVSGNLAVFIIYLSVVVEVLLADVSRFHSAADIGRIGDFFITVVKSVGLV